MSPESLCYPVASDRSHLYFRGVTMPQGVRGKVKLAAPAFLVLVAGVQLTLARAQALTAWKGGGFGMFSTVDSRNARFLRIHLLAEGKETAVQLPRTAQVLAREIRSLPTTQRLQRLADTLAALSWVRPPAMGNQTPAAGEAGSTPDRLRPRAKDDPEAAGVPISGVKVELWRYTFDTRNAVLRAAPLAQAVASPPGAAR
jgi:hypothetical protein